MSWFASLKEKSIKLAQLYKNELSDFMTNLNEEIQGKNDDSFEQGSKALRTQEPQLIEVESTPVLHDRNVLLEILGPFLSKEISDDELQAQISIVTSDPDEYFSKDPVELMLPDRTDFTTFEEFQERHYYAFTSETYEKIANSDPNLQKLLKNSDLKETTEDEYSMNILRRLLYSLIYLLEARPQEEILPQLEQTGEGEQDIVFPREPEGAATHSGDASENKNEVSEQYIVVEDGSSNSNRSSSNETERIESTGQRDVVSVSGSEDWQGEEKTFTMEFTG